MNDFKSGFEDLNEEISIDSLEISGKIPEWLSGMLLRTGPAKFGTKNEKFNHWFDGFAMLHNFTFHSGKVSYINKFLQSDAYKLSQKNGKINYREFATDPCRSIFKNFFTIFNMDTTDNGNVNITKILDDYLALTETTLPISFDPKILQTKNHFKFDDGIRGQITTAHPHFDFETKEGYNYIVNLSYKSHYLVYRFRQNDKKRKLLAKIAVDKPGYMHSFALTKNYVILVEWPLVVNPLDLAFKNKPFITNYKWEAQKGVRFILVNRKSGEVAIKKSSEAYFAFHHINAFEQENNLIIDIAVYKDPGVLDAFYLNKLKGDSYALPRSNFRRFVADIASDSITSEEIVPGSIELPRINYAKYNTRQYQFAYGASLTPAGDFFNQLTKIDISNKKTATWRESGTYPGEPVFIPSPSAEKEDEGVILSVVFDSSKNASFLLILNARDFREIGRAFVPHHIPFGFHGNFYK